MLFLISLLLQVPIAEGLAPLSWLTGCWESPDGAYQETWSDLRGNTLLGYSRRVKNGETIEFEFLQLKRDQSGISYIAHPSGQQKTAFLLISLSEDEAVFENKTHDFPQIIRYRRHKDGTLTARIEGVSKGKPRGIDFPLRKVTCP